MPYKELVEHCGVCSATIASVVRKLEAFGILKISDKGKRNAKYKVDQLCATEWKFGYQSR